MPNERMQRGAGTGGGRRSWPGVASEIGLGCAYMAARGPVERGATGDAQDYRQARVVAGREAVLDGSASGAASGRLRLGGWCAAQ